MHMINALAQDAAGYSGYSPSIPKLLDRSEGNTLPLKVSLEVCNRRFCSSVAHMLPLSATDEDRASNHTEHRGGRAA